MAARACDELRVKVVKDRCDGCGVGKDCVEGTFRPTVFELDSTPSESMASRREFEEPENEVARLSYGPVGVDSSCVDESYMLLGAGSERVDSIDFRLDMRR